MTNTNVLYSKYDELDKEAKDISLVLSLNDILDRFKDEVKGSSGDNWFSIRLLYYRLLLICDYDYKDDIDFERILYRLFCIPFKGNKFVKPYINAIFMLLRELALFYEWRPKFSQTKSSVEINTINNYSI